MSLSRREWLTAAALVCVMPSILARPHVLALPLLEWWVAGLLIARQERRAPAGSLPQANRGACNSD